MDPCKMCFEDITELLNVKYKLSEIDEFKNFVYCSECLELLIDNQWEKYVTNLKKVDCEKSLLSLVNDGPPMNFRDTHIEDNKEIYEFYYNDKIYSAKLKGSLDENERKELHNKLINIVTNLQNGTDYDYLSNINKLIIEFNL
jgi:hypothetical protein